MKRNFTVLLCILAGTIAAFAQKAAFQDSLLDEFAGSWILSGTIENQHVTHDVEAGWILGHEYLQFREVSREKDSVGAPAYEALVTIGWDQASGQYACQWLDNTSGAGLNGIIAYAKREPNRMAFLFKSKDGSVFHTTFLRDRASDRWQWVMDGEENGKLQPFARLTMQRR